MHGCSRAQETMVKAESAAVEERDTELIRREISLKRDMIRLECGLPYLPLNVLM